MSITRKYKNEDEMDEQECQESDYCYLDEDSIKALLDGKVVIANGDEFPIRLQMMDGVDSLITIVEYDGKEHDYDAELEDEVRTLEEDDEDE
jgi:hypothetical protein